MRVDSSFEVVGHIGSEEMPITKGNIAREPMLLQAEADYAHKHGGDLTSRFLEALPTAWQGQRLIIDSRVHMLQPGMIPAIPGWHLDAVPRGGPHNQPQLFAHNDRAQHIICFVGLAPTDLLYGAIDLSEPPAGVNVYGHWHQEIEQALNGDQAEVRVQPAVSGDLTYIDSHTFHQATPAGTFGWRFFIRASRLVPFQPRNEIRVQTQVYLHSVGRGW